LKHVALTTGTNTWAQGLDVVVEGIAVRVTHPDALQRLADALGEVRQRPTLRCYQLSYRSHPTGAFRRLPQACHETDKGAEESG
jgi:hypothetical protein